MATGQESILVSDHYLLYASPYSEHLFTRAYPEGYFTTTYNIVDYSGGVHELGRTPEHITLAKWIDADRVLLNKYSTSSTDGKCFIYHLNENRWEYLAEGYGFDYDADTGRVFLLVGSGLPF